MAAEQRSQCHIQTGYQLSLGFSGKWLNIRQHDVAFVSNNPLKRTKNCRSTRAQYIQQGNSQSMYGLTREECLSKVSGILFTQYNKNTYCRCFSQLCFCSSNLNTELVEKSDRPSYSIKFHDGMHRWFCTMVGPRGSQTINASNVAGILFPLS